MSWFLHTFTIAPAYAHCLDVVELIGRLVEIAVEGLIQEMGLEFDLEKMHFKVLISGSYFINFSFLAIELVRLNFSLLVPTADPGLIPRETLSMIFWI